LQLGGCPDRQNFGLVRVELEAVLQVPLPDVSSTCGENGKPIGPMVLCISVILPINRKFLRYSFSLLCELFRNS